MLRFAIYIALLYTMVTAGCTPADRDIGDAVESRALREQQIEVAIVFPTVDLRQTGQYLWRFTPTISGSLSPELWSPILSEAEWASALASSSIEMALNGEDGQVVWRASSPSKGWRVTQPTEQWTGTSAGPLEWTKVEAGTSYEFVLTVNVPVDAAKFVVTPRMITPRNPYTLPALLGVR